MSLADKPIAPVNPEGQSMTCAGMTLLEHYAGLAIQGILANPAAEPQNEIHFKNIALDAVAAARALIAELEKEQQA